MQSNGQKSIIYQSRKDFPFNEMRRRLLNCNVLNPSCYPVNSYQCCQLRIKYISDQTLLITFNMTTYVKVHITTNLANFCLFIKLRVGNTVDSYNHPPLFSKECIFQKNYFFPGTLISEPRQHYYQES